MSLCQARFTFPSSALKKADQERLAAELGEQPDYQVFMAVAEKVGLGGFHVLAGANGAGKTTLLDIPVLLGDLLAQQRVADAFLRPQEWRGGAPGTHADRTRPPGAW